VFIEEYFYKTANLKTSNNSMIIAETKNRRQEYMNEVFYSLYKDEIDKFKTKEKTALLFCGGATEHHSTSRTYLSLQKAVMPVKSQMGYLASKVAKRLGNIEYLSINANTCASSMYAFYQGYILLNYENFESVIIYGEEWVEDVELLLFKQFNIDIVCSDGFFILKLSKYPKTSKACVLKPSFLYADGKSAFEVTKDGYKKAMKPFKLEKIDLVKMHGTGTKQNNQAEYEAIKELFGNIKTLEYKSQIGHSQGCSTGVELCMLLDDNSLKNKNILVNASGFGNFYGSLVLKR